MAEPQWSYETDAGAILTIDDETADCVLDITNCRGCNIRGVLLRGNKKAKKVQHGIYQNNTAWDSFKNTPVLDNVRVRSFSGNGMFLKKVDSFVIRHSYFQDNNNGVCVSEAKDGMIYDCQFSGNRKSGFLSEIYSASVQFTACRVEANGEYGISLTGDGTNGKSWHLTGNLFDRNGYAAIYANNISDSAFTGNAFLRNARNAATAESCHVFMQNCRGIALVGNVGSAGRGDDGTGAITPIFALCLRDNIYCVVTSNTFSEGYRTAMESSSGNANMETTNNIGSPISG